MGGEDCETGQGEGGSVGGGVDFAPFSLLHPRNPFLRGNRRHPQHSPLHLALFHNPPLRFTAHFYHAFPPPPTIPLPLESAGIQGSAIKQTRARAFMAAIIAPAACASAGFQQNLGVAYFPPRRARFASWPPPCPRRCNK